jgi:hypothetical protein
MMDLDSGLSVVLDSTLGEQPATQQANRPNVRSNVVFLLMSIGSSQPTTILAISSARWGESSELFQAR